MSLAELIAVARGDRAADLLLVNARIVNTFTGEIEEGNVALCGERIAGVGDYRRAEQTVDLNGKLLAPAFINGHIHLESSLLSLAQYAKVVVPRGTSAVVTDLHEIANVCGLEGVRYMMNCARRLPLDLFFMAPSCVPATSLETSGATLGPIDIKRVLKWKNVIGLGEMMNFPGVMAGDEGVLSKIGISGGRVIDGHAPGLRGRGLNAYLAAGILSDHECTTLEEALEKLRRGMWLMIREGSSEKNIEALLPLVRDKNYQRCFFVVDDRSCVDLVRDGDIDAVVRKAIQKGLDPVRAIQMATINPAAYFRLNRVGAVAPGYLANLVVIDELATLRICQVFYRGRLVAEEGRPLFPLSRAAARGLSRTMHVKPFDMGVLRMPAAGGGHSVIEVIPGQILTRKRTEKMKDSQGVICSDIESDILKLVVVERHHATGNIGLGLVTGFGLQRGALASSVAHDSHNIIAVGVEDREIFTAIKEVERLQGGLVIAQGERVMAALPLPIAGLLSELPLEVVLKRLEELEGLASALGTSLPSPFSTLSFLALPVIPDLRLTDLGLVDVLASRLLYS